MNYILTCNDNTRKHLVDAFSYYNIQGSFNWFNSTECLFTTSMDNDTFVRLIETTPIVFVRHLFQVDTTPSNAELKQTVLAIDLDPNQSFSIQLRSPQHMRHEVNALRNDCVAAFEARGCELNVKNPDQIISIYVDEDQSYIGLGNAKRNLSTWSAGAMHFSRNHAMISRAEFKLLEAIEVFDLNLTGGVAVDLGAAPGGWSLVLANNGYHVHAIDPANLDERVQSNDAITHHNIPSQAFLEDNPDFSFNIIVNDMKMSYPQSIELIKIFSEHMHDDGVGILTIKLSKNFRFNDTVDALKRVRQYFDIQGGRQLFHNRNEFTLILKKKAYHENI